MRRILIIDEDIEAVGAASLTLESAGLVARAAPDLGEALQLLYQGWPEAVLVALDHERLDDTARQLLLDHPTCVLELRTALEPWPVIGDAGGSGTSRPVDNSLERLQLFLTGAVGETPEAGTLAKRYVILCNGHRVPLRSTGVAGDYVGAVRFRARAPILTPHPALDPHGPLQFAVIDTWKSQFVGGMLYHLQVPDQADDLPLPQSADEARSRLQKRLVPLTEGAVPTTLPPLLVHPETPLTLDLRLVSQRTE